MGRTDLPNLPSQPNKNPKGTLYYFWDSGRVWKVRKRIIFYVKLFTRPLLFIFFSFFWMNEWMNVNSWNMKLIFCWEFFCLLQPIYMHYIYVKKKFYYRIMIWLRVTVRKCTYIYIHEKCQFSTPVVNSREFSLKLNWIIR